MPDAFTSSVETLAPEHHEYRRNPKRKQWGAFLDEVIFVLILIVAPQFWFVALIDFAIHLTIDRAKGFIASRFGVTQEKQHPWFWTLIGVDQALHHLTGFGLSIFMAANA